MDDGFGRVGMVAAVPFGQVPKLGRRQDGEQGAFPALRVGVPVPWCSPCPFLRVTKIQGYCIDFNIKKLFTNTHFLPIAPLQ